MGAHSYIWYLAWIAFERHLNTMHNDASNAWLTPTDCEANTACVLLDITQLCSTGAYIQCSCIHTALPLYYAVQARPYRVGAYTRQFA